MNGAAPRDPRSERGADEGVAGSGAAGGRARVVHAITMLELGGAQRNTLYTVAHLDRARFAAALVAGPGGM
ncbi:MAG: hypothetical protein ABFD84_16465, partial [Candidatus Polarisedimenticolia bacterium]